MSMMAAPQASAIRAASPIQRASQPANCTTCVRRPRPSTRSRASGRPSASAALAVISETTKPAPRSAARRRNGASVTPDIGAKITGFGSVMELRVTLTPGGTAVNAHEYDRVCASPHPSPVASVSGAESGSLLPVASSVNEANFAIVIAVE